MKRRTLNPVLSLPGRRIDNVHRLPRSRRSPLAIVVMFKHLTLEKLNKSVVSHHGIRGTNCFKIPASKIPPTEENRLQRRVKGFPKSTTCMKNPTHATHKNRGDETSNLKACQDCQLGWKRN
jgi:hypothetical protein